MRTLRPTGDDPPIYLWVIYEHPKDFPDHYVVRRWQLLGDVCAPKMDIEGSPALTLEEARAFVPNGASCIGRDPYNDDPVIKEVWI